MKLNISQLLLDIAEMIGKKFDPISEKVDAVETKIKDFTPYDDAVVLEMIDEQANITKTVQDKLQKLEEIEPYVFDDSELKESIKAIKIPAPYDDSELSEAIDKVIKKFDELEIPAPYDDEELVKSFLTLEDAVQVLKNAEPYSYDDTALKETFETMRKGIEALENAEPYKYDDTELNETIHSVKEAVKKLEEVEPYKYDDTSLSQDIVKVSDHLREVRESIPKAYDDAPILEAIKKLEEAEPYRYNDEDLIKTITAQTEVIAKLEKKIEEIDAKPLTLTVPSIVKYNVEPVSKGTFVKYNNALWLNVLPDNDTPPGTDNHSYQLVLEGPKPIEHMGLWDADKKYEPTNIVMYNDASWWKTTNPNQAIPSEGWKLLAKQGKQGKKGLKGDKGDVYETDTVEAMQTMYDTITQLEGKIKRLEDDNKK